MKQRFVNKKDLCIVAVLLLMGMIVGSFADLSISKALLNERSIFAGIMGCISEYPTGIAAVMAGTLLMRFHARRNKGVVLLNFLLGAFMILLGSYSNYAEFIGNCELNPVILLTITIFSSAVAIFLTIVLTKNTDREQAIRVAWVLFIAALGNTILVNIIKIPWARPRMRLIEHYPEIPFQSWWVVGNELKTKYLSEFMIASSEFKSMPSGHTANAAVALLLPLLSCLNSRFCGKERLLFWIGVAWTFLCALGRIIIGAHFLTDTLIGFLLTFVLEFGLMYIFFERGKDNGKN